MTSNVAKTLAIGSCAFALVALTDGAQAQGGFGGAVVGTIFPWFPFQPPRQLPPCQYDGQIVTLTLNTGTALPVGSADPIWTVSPGPIAYSTTAVAGGWLPNQPTAKWIQPAAGGTPVDFFPSTTLYTYTTQFSTPFHPYFYNSIAIAGMFAGDDSAVLTLNGVTFNCPSTASGSTTCYHVGKAFGISGYQNFAQTGTAPYVNTLTIQVNNSHSIYSGLFVKATLRAVCSKCTSPVPVPCNSPPFC